MLPEEVAFAEGVEDACVEDVEVADEGWEEEDVEMAVLEEEVVVVASGVED